MEVLRSIQPFAIPIQKHFSVFLGGRFSSDQTNDFREVIEQKLSDSDGVILTASNQQDWVGSISEPCIEGDNQFTRHVVWGFLAQEEADMVVLYFDSESNSPTTMLELGLAVQYPDKIIVFCSDDFEQKATVDIVCKYNRIKQVHSIDAVVDEIKSRL